jgi:tetratricopeptide (TPR) repeat protein
MSANVPIVRTASWLAVIVIILVWIIFMAVFTFLFQIDGIYIGSILFFILMVLLQRLIPTSLIKGMKAIKKNDFKTALEFFNKSVDFFTQYDWVDKYRAITLLSAAKMSYREMSLCNMAFCYSQTNEGEKAKDLYEQILKEYPDNGIAYYSLNSINTFSNKSD